MCVDDYEGAPIIPIRGKECRKFIITDQQEISRTFLVNISQFEEPNQEIAICKILIHLSTKGLTIENRKFYMQKFKEIIEPFTLCRIKFEDLLQKQVRIRSYPVSKDNQQILKQNSEMSLSPFDTPQTFKQVVPSGFELYSMAEEKFYFSQQLNQNIKLEECQQCFLPPPDLRERKLMFPPNQQIQHSLLFLRQELYAQKMETENKIQNKSELSQQNSPNESKSSSSNISGNLKLEPRTKKPAAKINSRRTREPERKVAEVILMTKVWRQLHEKKGWSLLDAAKVVGISKKSLDDYFLVLRQGVIHGYDYSSNLTNGMGELRSFIRQKENKVSGKLAKAVECFNLVPELNLDFLIDQYRRGQPIQLSFE